MFVKLGVDGHECHCCSQQRLLWSHNNNNLLKITQIVTLFQRFTLKNHVIPLSGCCVPAAGNRVIVSMCLRFQVKYFTMASFRYYDETRSLSSKHKFSYKLMFGKQHSKIYNFTFLRYKFYNSWHKTSIAIPN